MMETVLITGAARGIGLALTRQFLTLGYQVIATYRRQPSAALNDLLSYDTLTLIELEVTDGAAIQQLVDSLDGRPIDILINNAGVIGPENQSLETIAPDAWLQTFAVNTIAPLMLTRALLGHLEAAENPRVITISSQMGALHLAQTDKYAYRSSKAALNKVMQVLALELKARGVIVCPLHPGWVKTDMGGDAADITVEESASGIVAFARQLTMAESGRFFTWQGKEHVW